MNPKLEEICKIAYSYKETVYFTYNITRELVRKTTDGYFIECGVGAGAQIAAMKLAMDDEGGHFDIYGFDSFEGIPLAGPNDLEQPGIGKITHDTSLPESERLVSSGITVHSADDVRRNIKKFGLGGPMFLIRGWFQNTLQLYKKTLTPIVLLRLDGDLYESTICCLENLYDNVVEGGVVIIDDYQLEGAQKAVHDFFDSRGINPVLEEIEGSGGVKYFYKQSL